MLPTGHLAPTAGTALDFTQGSPADATSHRTLSHAFPEAGVDHNLVFSSPTSAFPRVVLSAPDGRTSLAFRTNQSSVQCYTAGGMDGSGSRKAAHGEGGYDRFAAVVSVHVRGFFLLSMCYLLIKAVAVLGSSSNSTTRSGRACTPNWRPRRAPTRSSNRARSTITG